MTGYHLAPRARADIAKAWFLIAKDSERNADRVQDAIYKNIDLLAASPTLGHVRPDITTKAVLVWPALPYKNYLIIYERMLAHIRVLRVLHAARAKAWRTL